MPKLHVNGVELYYEDEGSGPDTILFTHSLLFSGRMFDAQVAALKDRYRCVRFDFRGQGRSPVTAGGYDIDTLTEDTIGVIEALECAPCHFVGFSMGGFVGLRLGFRRPELLRSLMLLDTSADPEPPENLPRYRLLNLIARWLGAGVVAGQVMSVFFGPSFMSDPARAAQRVEWQRRIAANDRIGATRAVKGVITRQGVIEEIHNIPVPTLILVGAEDAGTAPHYSERMHERIPDSELVIVPGTGHMTPVEAPDVVTGAMEAFLSRVG